MSMVTPDYTLISSASSYTLSHIQAKEQKASYKYFASHNVLAGLAEHFMVTNLCLVV